MLKKLIMDYMENKSLKYSVYIKNLKTSDICCINETEIVPSASIIKLFIMVKAFEIANEGTLDLNQRISIDKTVRVPYSILYNLDDSNTYTIKDIITLMIIQSDNTATNQLINMLGMDNINKFIIDYGFSDTVLNRKMMDFAARKIGLENYTSMQDVGALLELMYKGQLINEKYSDMMLEIMKLQLDGSIMRIDLDDELIIAHKTGDLPNLKHDAGIVYTESMDYIFAMVVWDAASDTYARNTIGKVSKLTYDYLISDTSHK